MRAFAITGIVTASWISRTLSGSAIRATPPSRLMSAGTRSSAITATAPASSAIRACSAVVTSMITPPLSISARPLFTRIVPISAMAAIVAGLLEAAEDALELGGRRRDRPYEDGVVLALHHVVQVSPKALGDMPAVAALDVPGGGSVVRERDRHGVPGLRCPKRAIRGRRGDHPEVGVVRVDSVPELAEA